MFEVKSIRADHNDVIHDVVHDYYGKRMATCSSDHTVKVWDLDEQDKWTISASWKAHSGSIWRLSWAHPEFGQVLATCSFDRTASIWEEIIGEKATATMTPIKRWTRRANLVDSRTSVTDVKFAPRHLGLLLATASADGTLRIYEAPDIVNLSQWSLQHEISCKMPLSCISWNKSMFRLHAPMIAAGSDDTAAGGKVFIFEYSENSRKWTKIETLSNVTDPVHDISFAPSCGRSFHILAVASKDLYIFHLKPIPEHTGNRLDVQQAAHFLDHNCTVWRVSWNITGTMLASTGDDGCARIWKMNYMRAWKCVTVLKSEDNEPTETQVQQIPVTTALTPTSAKYSKKTAITSPNQFPWH